MNGQQNIKICEQAGASSIGARMETLKGVAKI